jgi:hypothetical protein
VVFSSATTYYAFANAGKRTTKRYVNIGREWPFILKPDSLFSHQKTASRNLSVSSNKERNGQREQQQNENEKDSVGFFQLSTSE